MKKQITHDDYLRFLGLATLQAEHDRATKDIEHAAASLFDLSDSECLDFYRTHAYDALHGSRNPREALRLMGIEIKPASTVLAEGTTVVEGDRDA